MITIGRRMRGLRLARKLPRNQVAPSLGITAQYLYDIERSKKACSRRVALLAADFFGLKGQERDAFLASREALVAREEAAPKSGPRPKSLPLARFTCAGGCNHDGKMAPGGSEQGGEKDANCANYNHCLGVFVRAHRDARTCHCPQYCPSRRYEAAAPVATAGWGSMTFPGHGKVGPKHGGRR